MMNFDQALQSVLQFDIKSHCHVNTNEDGDRFVEYSVAAKPSVRKNGNHLSG